MTRLIAKHRRCGGSQFMFLQGLLRVMTRRLTVMKLVFISSGEPLNYNFASFRGWCIGFALESTGCKGKGDGRGFRGE